MMITSMLQYICANPFHKKSVVYEATLNYFPINYFRQKPTFPKGKFYVPLARHNPGFHTKIQTFKYLRVYTRNCYSRKNDSFSIGSVQITFLCFHRICIQSNINGCFVIDLNCLQFGYIRRFVIVLLLFAHYPKVSVNMNSSKKLKVILISDISNLFLLTRQQAIKELREILFFQPGYIDSYLFEFEYYD